MAPARAGAPPLPAILRGRMTGFPKKTGGGGGGVPERQERWIQFAQSRSRLQHTNHAQAVSVWCLTMSFLEL